MGGSFINRSYGSVVIRFCPCTQYSPCTYGDFTYTVSNSTVTITQYVGSGERSYNPGSHRWNAGGGIGGYYSYILIIMVIMGRFNIADF